VDDVYYTDLVRKFYANTDEYAKTTIRELLKLENEIKELHISLMKKNVKVKEEINTLLFPTEQFNRMNFENLEKLV